MIALAKHVAAAGSLIFSTAQRMGRIVDPEPVDWMPASAFVTPPGLWHTPYKESVTLAYLLPNQDAGLQTYLRTQDSRFSDPD
jgi:hypothetical protein